jgi:hypothetical protein
MTTPSEPDNGRSADPSEGVDLSKDDPPFDPYRFGAPDHPIPAEYAPPGYSGPVTPVPVPYGTEPPTGGYAGSPGNPANPFGNPPGTPYGPPYQYPPQGPYGPPYGYGAPTPPPYHGYAQPRTGNGKAVAALVFGILSLVFFWLTIFDVVFVALGLVFSLIALGESRSGRSGGRGLAVSGLICTIIGAIGATIFTIWIFHAADQCGGFSNNDRPGFNQCVKDNF